MANGLSADLSWTASASPFATGYNVYRSTSSGCCYGFVAWVPGGGSTTHNDPGLSGGTTYYYALQTISQNWTSGNSNEAAVTP